MFPTIFEIGRFKLHTFGFMMAMSFLVSVLMAGRRFPRHGIDSDLASDVGLGAMFGGVLGAKLYFIFDHWREFLVEPFAMFFSGSGLTWYGGLLGGVIGALLVARARRIPLMLLCDVASPILGVGYAIGRLGCFLNGDDYGRPSSVPWAMAFPKGTPATLVRVHPTQLYEVAGGLLIFFLLDRLDRRPRPRGQLFGIYLILSGLARFGVEIYRTNEPAGLGLTVAQWISLGLILFGLSILSRSRATTAAA